MGTARERSEKGRAQLGLWDAVSIIVGIVIGSSIYTTPPDIFGNVPGPVAALGVWLLCGALSLVGALCYAELTTTYPRAGGDYVYLTRAFGPEVGFLFGWSQLAVILSGSTGAMAFIFGEYTADLCGIAPAVKTSFAAVAAAGAVVLLALMNAGGVVLGKWVQNILVAAKVLGLGGIVVVGLVWGRAEAWPASEPLPADVPGFGLAMILVLYAYGGWNDAAFVAADVRHRRDLPRALILGTILISFIYLAVNAAYINGLGFHGARAAGPTIAAKLLSLGVGDAAGKVMCVLVMISALGAINGLLFTGSRLFTSLGSEHSIFALLGRWHPRWKAPLWSLAVQVAVALAMILLVGTEAGRTALNAVLGSVRLGRIPWEDYHGGFTTLFAGTAPVFWVFFLLTGVSVFVLRFRDRHVLRPFALPVPFFPVLPAIFCGMCLYGLYSAATYAGMVALLGVVPLAVGLPLYLISRRTPSAETTVEEPTR